MPITELIPLSSYCISLKSFIKLSTTMHILHNRIVLQVSKLFQITHWTPSYLILGLNASSNKLIYFTSSVFNICVQYNVHTMSSTITWPIYYCNTSNAHHRNDPYFIFQSIILMDNSNQSPFPKNSNFLSNCTRLFCWLYAIVLLSFLVDSRFLVACIH